MTTRDMTPSRPVDETAKRTPAGHHSRHDGAESRERAHRQGCRRETAVTQHVILTRLMRVGEVWSPHADVSRCLGDNPVPERKEVEL